MIADGLVQNKRGLGKLLQGVDPIFSGATLALMTIGLMAIFSVGQAMPEAGLVKRQFLQFFIGLVPFAFCFVLPGSVWRRLSWALYLFNVLLLLLVLTLGKNIGGATRWLDVGPLRFQPSELCKLLVVITLSTFFYNRLERVKHFTTYLGSFLHVIPIAALLILQPHLGSTLTVLVAWLTIALVAGVPLKYPVLSLLAAIALFGAAYKSGALPQYMVNRVLGFSESIATSTDPSGERSQEFRKGKGYQQYRAQIAFGVGGVAGSGYLKGEQKNLRGVPEQETDMIFSVIGEEAGLIGSALVLVAFAAYFLRGWFIGVMCRDLFGRMAALGALSILGFHLVVNLAMNLGVGPVIGLWLPFISYGGTALWLCLCVTGLILNLCRKQEEEMFAGKRLGWEE